MASKKDRSTSSRNSQNTGKADANSVSASSTVASATGAAKPATPVAAAAAAAPAAPVAKVVAAPVAVTSPVATPAAAVAATAVVEAKRDRSSIELLISKLRDQDAEVARDAAATLGRLPADAQAVDALAAVLTNSDGYFHSVVRAAAASALGTLGDRRAVDALIHATGDSMAEASDEAIKALGLLGDRRALPALANIVRNDSGFYLENVRRAAQDAAARISAAKA